MRSVPFDQFARFCPELNEPSFADATDKQELPRADDLDREVIEIQAHVVVLGRIVLALCYPLDLQFLLYGALERNSVLPLGVPLVVDDVAVPVHADEFGVLDPLHANYRLVCMVQRVDLLPLLRLLFVGRPVYLWFQVLVCYAQAEVHSFPFCPKRVRLREYLARCLTEV